MHLTLEDFVEDTPWADDIQPLEDVVIDDMIDGVRLQRLVTRTDNRGDLTVLFSSHRLGPAPHVYLVTAEPGSIRAWVYHKHQADRLAFCSGLFRVVLYDLRPDSPTKDRLNVMELGAENKVLLTIPPFVIHGVENVGSAAAQFVNMPTKAYDPKKPDKSRVQWNHPGIPYRFG
jgi:dTDP-4-dehydrorhamnose 3,5-epimerase